MTTRRMSTVLVMAVTIALAAPGAWAAPPTAEMPRSIIAILIGLFRQMI